MYADQVSDINKTLIESAVKLGAKVQNITEDAVAATLPKNMGAFALVQATQLLVRAIPRSQVMRCDETENEIELVIQIG